MQQAQDFRGESAALAVLLTPLSDAEFDTPTLFKGWTINKILRHLHVWNIAAGKSLDGGEVFSAFLAQLMGGERGLSFNAMESRYLDGLSGGALLTAWRDEFERLADRFDLVDPKLRLNGWGRI